MRASGRRGQHPLPLSLQAAFTKVQLHVPSIFFDSLSPRDVYTVVLKCRMGGGFHARTAGCVRLGRSGCLRFMALRLGDSAGASTGLRFTSPALSRTSDCPRSSLTVPLLGSLRIVDKDVRRFLQSAEGLRRRPLGKRVLVGMHSQGNAPIVPPYLVLRCVRVDLKDFVVCLLSHSSPPIAVNDVGVRDLNRPVI